MLAAESRKYPFVNLQYTPLNTLTCFFKNPDDLDSLAYLVQVRSYQGIIWHCWGCYSVYKCINLSL